MTNGRGMKDHPGAVIGIEEHHENAGRVSDARLVVLPDTTPTSLARSDYAPVAYWIGVMRHHMGPQRRETPSPLQDAGWQGDMATQWGCDVTADQSSRLQPQFAGTLMASHFLSDTRTAVLQGMKHVATMSELIQVQLETQPRVWSREMDW